MIRVTREAVFKAGEMLRKAWKTQVFWLKLQLEFLGAPALAESFLVIDNLSRVNVERRYV
jgi:hypothetical protein